VSADVLDVEMVCVMCHRSMKRLVILAMLMDAGAHVMPSPLECDHEFAKEEAENG